VVVAKDAYKVMVTAATLRLRRASGSCRGGLRQIAKETPPIKRLQFFLYYA